MATDPSAADRRRSAIIERHREAAAEVVSRSEESLYVGGEWVEADGGETFPTIDPTTGERLAAVQSGTAADVDRAVEAAWRAYDREWSDASPADRQRVLSGIADRIEASAEAFATLDALDNGKPITEARTDVDLAADHFRYFGGLRGSSRGRRSRWAGTSTRRRSGSPTASSARSRPGTSRC